MKMELMQQLKAEAKSHADSSASRFQAAKSLLMVDDTVAAPIEPSQKKSEGAKFWLTPHDRASISSLVRDAGLEGFRCNRSQVIRAGVRLLAQLTRAQLVAAIEMTIVSSDGGSDIEVRSTPPTT